MELVKEPVKTGDILLFDYQEGWISWAIKFFTRSNYSHVGMVVVDPQFTEIPLKGVYLWESGRGYIPDPENHRLKTGVQLTPMEQVFKTFEGKPQKGEFFNPYKLGSKPKQRVENKPQSQNNKSLNNTNSNPEAIIEDEENN